MNADNLREYKKLVSTVQEELQRNTGWISKYDSYAKNLLKNEKAFIDARKLFREYPPLHIYLTMGIVNNNQKQFDLRYLGQSVGTINVKDESVMLKVSDSQAENSRKYYGYKLGTMNVPWGSDGKAAAFRRFFKSEVQGMPRQKEHMYESALFSEMGKKKSDNKALCNITTVGFANTRIHMKTAVKGSSSGEVNDKGGGEIDLLCRRSIKAGRGESRLVVIEIKDENKKSESFDKVMKQAISYAVFMSELIHSGAGENWMKIWGMKNQKRNSMTIDCVVAMPQGKTIPGYAGDRIELNNGHALELHYIEITGKVDSQHSEDVSFHTSMK